MCGGYGGCNPQCDNCQPKFVYCPTCGGRLFLLMNKCFYCGTEITDEMKQQARKDWEKTHTADNENARPKPQISGSGA